MLRPPQIRSAVEFHTGDSTVQIAETLARLADEGGMDFALVDGDQSGEGVERDAEAFLV